MSTKSFTAACREFFGFKPGQTLAGFAEELRALTPKDKADIYEGFKAIGIQCDPPAQSA